MKELSFRDISDRLKNMDLPQFDTVVGIAEGGKILAGLVAYKLGSDLKIIYVKDHNDLSRIKGNVLIVDDVQMSGKTMEFTKKLLAYCNIKTMVVRGEADYVLFPELDECVKWPWSKY